MRPRVRTQQFIGAARPEEIIFTKNATEALNLVAYSYGRANIREGDEIVITISSITAILFRQFVAKRVVRRSSTSILRRTATYRQRILRADHGKDEDCCCDTCVECARSCQRCAYDCRPCSCGRGGDRRDGSQSVPHIAVDVQAMDADFFAFSGHKMLSPMGTACSIAIRN